MLKSHVSTFPENNFNESDIPEEFRASGEVIEPFTTEESDAVELDRR